MAICFIIFQSTLPRGERRSIVHSFCPYFIISIHAPARGATEYSFKSAICSQISIHAPARGATFFQRSNFRNMRNFNPRSREGSDALYVESSNSANYFNPRSREGSDRSSQPIAVVYFPFQSTLPRGERPMYPPFLRIDGNFNPRSREGSDWTLMQTTPTC